MVASTVALCELRPKSALTESSGRRAALRCGTVRRYLASRHQHPVNTAECEVAGVGGRGGGGGEAGRRWQGAGDRWAAGGGGRRQSRPARRPDLRCPRATQARTVPVQPATDTCRRLLEPRAASKLSSTTELDLERRRAEA